MIGRVAVAMAVAMVLGSVAAADDDYKPVGTFLLQSHFKLTGGVMTPIPIKPLLFKVFSNGTHVRVSTGEDESHTTYLIYRSDGIGRQQNGRGALEVIPGLQATCQTDGVLRHLRLSRESLTITTFPGVSDQTIVSHAVAAEPKTTDRPRRESQPPKP